MNDGDDPAGSAYRLLVLICEHAVGLRDALDPEQYALLHARLTDLVETDPEDGRAVRRALRGVHLALLPLPLDHRVYRALDAVRSVPPGPPGRAGAVTGARELLARLPRPRPAEPAPAADEARAGRRGQAPPGG